MNDEMVSVVIPAYNRREMVCEAIDSVLRQTYLHREILVVDNGSTDGTGEVLRRYRDRIHYIFLPTPGLSNARNEGIKAARGAFVGLLDSDDLWMDEKLEKQMPLFENPETVFICSDVYYCHRVGQPLSRYFDIYKPARGNVLPELFLRLFMHPSTMILRKSVLERSGCFDANFELAEEYDFAIRVAALGRVDFVPEPLVWARLHGANESRQRRVRLWLEVNALCEKAAQERPQLKKDLGSRLSRRLCEIKIGVAFEFLRLGCVTEAFEWLREAWSRGKINAGLELISKLFFLSGRFLHRLKEKRVGQASIADGGGARRS